MKVSDKEEQEERRFFQKIGPGGIYYGNQGEKPEVLENKRNSANFAPFAELVLRAQGASLGLPYEEVLKDFSKTNYSSARAAINAAWKVYQFYRSWFSRLYCQPLWSMVQEEAWLRGLLRLPSSAPDFYEAAPLWCNAYWYGPSRGYVDPMKEIQANILAIANRLMTRTAHWAQQGEDFYEGMDAVESEEERMAGMPGQTPVILNKTGVGGGGTAPTRTEITEEKEDEDADE